MTNDDSAIFPFIRSSQQRAEFVPAIAGSPATVNLVVATGRWLLKLPFPHPACNAAFCTCWA